MSFVMLRFQCTSCFLVALILFQEPALAADDSLVDALQRCSLVEENMARLACFDSIVVAAESVPSPTQASVESAAPAVAELGAETLPRGNKPSSEEAAVTAVVTRCEKDGLKKYLFYFDNGQVWKQVSSKRLFFRECDFEVKIWKDTFGYKMQQTGEKARIRIKRIR